jgi:hypothetical protein
MSDDKNLRDPVFGQHLRIVQTVEAQARERLDLPQDRLGRFDAKQSRKHRRMLAALPGAQDRKRHAP